MSHHLRSRYINQKRVRCWRNKLRNVPCFIIGNSPYLDGKNLHVLDDFFTIGINRTFIKIDPTLLIWQDISLFHEHYKELLTLEAILFCNENADPRGIAYHFKLLKGKYRITNSPAVLAGKGNTAPLAYQAAFLLGCNPIIFVGCDCQYKGDKTDFYGVNRHHNKNTIPNCRRGLNWIKKNSNKREIISCDKSGTFTDILSLSEAIDKCFSINKPAGREHYKTILLSR